MVRKAPGRLFADSAFTEGETNKAPAGKAAASSRVKTKEMRRSQPDRAQNSARIFPRRPVASLTGWSRLWLFLAGTGFSCHKPLRLPPWPSRLECLEYEGLIGGLKGSIIPLSTMAALATIDNPQRMRGRRVEDSDSGSKETRVGRGAPSGTSCFCVAQQASSSLARSACICLSARSEASAAARMEAAGSGGGQML